MLRPSVKHKISPSTPESNPAASFVSPISTFISNAGICSRPTIFFCCQRIHHFIHPPPRKNGCNLSDSKTGQRQSRAVSSTVVQQYVRERGTDKYYETVVVDLCLQRSQCSFKGCAIRYSHTISCKLKKTLERK
jgi:hypothetical protein